ETFERFIHRKWVGTKRFGLDGADSAIPALEQIVRRAAELGVEEIAIGMPHRGRLNVLANVMLKPYRTIFAEFSGSTAAYDDYGSGEDRAVGLEHRSEEHTSELQSLTNIVCRLL